MIGMVTTVLRTPTDIFPDINIPVVSVIWFYTGMSPQDMADRIVANSERGITTTVNDIEHIESQSVPAWASSRCSSARAPTCRAPSPRSPPSPRPPCAACRPGTTPPLIISYNASTTPIIQLGLSSKTLPEQELFDLGQNFLRNYLATVPGAATPFPYGGKVRQIQVDLDLKKLQAYGLQPVDIVNAVNAQNLILPSGTVKLGALEYNVEMNGTPQTIAGAQRPAGEDRQRLHPLHARRGARPRRLLAPDQHRAGRRRPRRADVDLQERQRLHPGRSWPGSRTSSPRRPRPCRRA